MVVVISFDPQSSFLRSRAKSSDFGACKVIVKGSLSNISRRQITGGLIDTFDLSGLNERADTVDGLRFADAGPTGQDHEEVGKGVAAGGDCPHTPFKAGPDRRNRRPLAE